MMKEESQCQLISYNLKMKIKSFYFEARNAKKRKHNNPYYPER